jgi:hypothetical protein
MNRTRLDIGMTFQASTGGSDLVVPIRSGLVT